MREVVAPPMSKGKFKFLRFISWAMCTISSKDGVIRPDKPITSTSKRTASSNILLAGTITPKSIISYPLQANTTPTMFFPISCTSPFTVANKTFPAEVSSTFPASINGCK